MVENDAVSSSPFLAHGGERGALIRAKDWSESPLGPVERWPLSLRTAVAIMLRTKQPTFIGLSGDRSAASGCLNGGVARHRRIGRSRRWLREVARVIANQFSRRGAAGLSFTPRSRGDARNKPWGAERQTRLPRELSVLRIESRVGDQRRSRGLVCSGSQTHGRAAQMG